MKYKFFVFACWAITVTIIVSWLLSEANGQCKNGICPPSQCSPLVQGNIANRWKAPISLQRPLEPAVVQTICRTGATTKRGTGTIIAVRRSTPRVGAILTTAHTLQAGGDVSIRYAGKIYPAQIADQDGTLDIALLTFAAPADCYIMRLADADPGKGTVLVWEGFTSGGPVRRQGPVVGYNGSTIWITGNAVDGMSGGPVISPLKGLVSVLTTGIGRTPEASTQIEGPALSWIKSFLRRGRYAWTLDGCVDVVRTPPPVPLPLVPVTEPPDLSAILLELAALRKSIEAIQLLPGPQGEPGPQGKKGDAGESGSFSIDDLTDEQIMVLASRLPPVILQTVTTEGEVIKEASAPLGKPLKLRLVPVQSGGE